MTKKENKRTKVVAMEQEPKRLESGAIDIAYYLRYSRKLRTQSYGKIASRLIAKLRKR